jgi:hypothetical protein
LKSNNKDLEQEFLISKLKNSFQENNSDNEDNKSEHSYEGESSNNLIPNDVKIISMINKVCPPKWYAKVHIAVDQDFAFDVIALIDSGADLNCIQEGLIPRKYFEKSNQRLNSAIGTKLQINYELNNVHVYQDGVYFHIPSVLVKNMSDKVILGIPFISMLYPFKAELGEVSTVKMGVPVRFHFASRFEIDISQLSQSLHCLEIPSKQIVQIHSESWNFVHYNIIKKFFAWLKILHFKQILNTFDFNKILNSDFQLFLIFSLLNFCSATMASKKDKEKIESQALVSKPESTSSLSSLPIFIDPPIYISLPFSQHLFYIEKNHSHIKSPKQLILSYFPPDFH